MLLPLWTPAQELVRAKVGIEIHRGERLAGAASRDRLRAGDQFRIYVIPEQNVYLYVVHTDKKNVSLLKATKVKSLSPVVLPSSRALYQVDGASPEEFITVICSPVEMTQILALFSASVSYKEWKKVEGQLLQESQIDLNQDVQKPFAIAGNVRAQTGIDLTNPGHQVSREGERISLPIRVQETTERDLTFGASDLPPGLSIATDTGVITGTIRSGAADHSPYHVQVSVSQGLHSSQAIFAWTVDPDLFFQQLRVSSGRSLLVKQYAFTVKK
jgi:hypothetical protein